MFIRFEIAGEGIWHAGYDADLWTLDMLRGIDRPWWGRRARPIRGGRQADFDMARREIFMDVDPPPDEFYDASEGRYCITFFRVVDAARPNIAAAWRMMSILREHGWPAYEIFRHTPPGIVTFRDERQIVVSVPNRAKRTHGQRWNGDRATIRKGGMCHDRAELWRHECGSNSLRAINHTLRQCLSGVCCRCTSENSSARADGSVVPR
jgi:hypothetical protein